MGRMGILSFVGTVLIVLQICGTAKAQTQFTVTESNETVDVGSIAAEIAGVGRDFRFEGGSPPCEEIFTIDDTGAISTTRGIDRESPIIMDNIDEFGWLSCTVAFLTADGNNGTRRVQFSIADVNDNAPQFPNLTGITVEENAKFNQIVRLFTVQDPDNGDNGTVDSVVMSGMGERFFVTRAQRVENVGIRVTLVTSNETIDREVYPQLNLTFTATDQGTPPKTSTIEVTINVGDENEHPPVFTLTQYEFGNVVDTTPVGTPIGTISAMDADSGGSGIVEYSITSISSTIGCNGNFFDVNSTTGVMYVARSLLQLRCSFTVRVEASNPGDNSRGDGAAVHIQVVAEMLYFEVGGNEIFVNHTFIEGPPDHLSPFWTVQGAGNYSIQFNGKSPQYDVQIVDSLVYMRLFNVDREETPFISGTLVIFSDEGIPPAPAKLHFNFTILDINDNAPVFETTIFSVPENSHLGNEIGLIVAKDTDVGENATVTYMQHSSTHEDLITLHTNGTLVVSSAIDFEQVERIELVVEARDQGTPPMSQNSTIFIDIVDVNESPEFSGNFDQRVLTSTPLPFSWHVTATDEDSGEFGNVTFRIVMTSTPNDASTFVTVHQQPGQLSELTLNRLPEPSSVPYQLVVQAVDGGNQSSSITISIRVWTDFCRDGPCRNGGICTNIDNSYTCACTDDYGGRNCSILKNPCDNLLSNPCLNGGTCSNTEDELDYWCTCTDSFSGRNCTFNSVSFKPRSFLSYELPGVSANTRDLRLSVQIAPKFLNGLLLYVGEGDDFISVELDNGRVMMRTRHAEVSDDNVMVTTNNIWYLIKMTMEFGLVPSVTVSIYNSSLDNMDINQLPSDQQLDDIETGTLFIGGLSADPAISYEHIRNNTDYVGCMRDLFINGKRVRLSGEDPRRLVSHNVEEGCVLDSTRPCTGCGSGGCINFLSNSLPYCDCTLSSSDCTPDVPTAVGFTGQANLIVETLDDFFIATQHNRHRLKATEPDVEQEVSFSFRSTTEEAILLSGTTVESSGLRVFWFGNSSLNFDIYEGNTRCGHVTQAGVFSDNTWYNVQLTIRSDRSVTLSVGDDVITNTSIGVTNCPSNLFVKYPSSRITITGRPAMHLSARLPDKDFQGCISGFTVDGITVPLAKDYTPVAPLVTSQEEGSVNEIHDGCEPNLEHITGEEDSRFLELYIIVIIVVVAILILVGLGLIICFGCKRVRHHPNKSRFDMSQEMPDVYQDSPPSTLNFRKKTEFDNASVGHYQEEGEESMPDATAISIDSLRKSACNSSGSGGTGSSAETGFHTGSERDHTSDAGFPESSTVMVNDETPSEVQESEYSTFVSDSDITSAVEQTLSPLDVQLLGPPNVLGMPPPPQARSMARKPSPSMKDPSMLSMERKISPFHHPHSRFSMSTIESGSESSLGPPPPPDPIMNYPHPSSMQHEPQLPGLKTLCGPDFNPISYWEQQSRLKPSIDPDYPLQRLSLASGRGTEDPSSTVSIASTLEEQHEFASQGGGEGEATNMRDGLESDHELDYRLADLHIPEYESMTLSQSTLVGGSEEYFPDATVKPCHPIVPVHDNSMSSNSPYHHTLPDHLHSPQSISSSSTSYEKNPHQRLLSEQDLSTHDRYYERSRTGASRPSHMISDHRLHAQYSTTSTTSSASTPQSRRAWRSEDPINV